MILPEICAKLLSDSLERALVIKLRSSVIVDHSAERHMHKIRKLAAKLLLGHVEHDLGGRIGAKLVTELDVNSVTAEKGCKHACCRNVGKRHAALELAHIHRAQIVVLLIREQIALDKRTRRHDSDDLALYKPFCERGVLGLLANSDLVAF